MREIKITKLSFGYDKNEVLSEINLEYGVEDFLSIIGPNGGGKSTLLRLILGLIEPNSGEITVFGKKPSMICSQLGYVPQNIPINTNFPISALEVTLMGRLDKKKFGFYTKFDKREALEALEKVGMREFFDKKISQLSGGERQRVYIARALCANARILVLDEPTASIDPRGAIQIYELLNLLNSQGIGVIMVSHDVNTALSFANKVAFVNKELVLHDIPKNSDKSKFIRHLSMEHGHFCDVEIALKECGC